MHSPESQKPAEQKKRVSMQARNLPLIGEEDATPEVDRLYALFRKNYSRTQIPGILQCFATHPPLLEHMMGLAEPILFTEGALGRQNKEMLATFVSSQNRCEYCSDSHGFFLRMNGGSSELLEAVRSCDLQSEAFAPKQSALIHFAQKITDDSSSIVPQDVEELRDLGWTDLQIAEAIHLTALFACFNRVVNAFGLPSQRLLADYEEQPQSQGKPSAFEREIPHEKGRNK
jgi:uncharacterized peroxidase-related enzyme